MSSHEEKQERQHDEENEAEPAPLEGPVDPTAKTDHCVEIVPVLPRWAIGVSPAPIQEPRRCDP